VTHLTPSVSNGGAVSNERSVRTSRDELFCRVYGKLRRIAVNLMSAERQDHLLQPSALVHEAYVRLIRTDRADWKSRSQVCAAATQEMRRILIDHARRRNGARRVGSTSRVSVKGVASPYNGDVLEALAIDEALAELAFRFPRPARIAELSLFFGLSRSEIARALEVSDSTVAHDWMFARSWLRRKLLRLRGRTP